MTEKVFDSIKIPVPKEKIYRRLGYKKGFENIPVHIQNELEESISEASDYIELKGIAKILSIKEKNQEYISLKNNIKFKSSNLSKMLENCDEILVFASTAGKKLIKEIEERMHHSRYLQGVVFDAVGSEMADSALEWIMEYFNKELAKEGKRLTRRRYSAGYGDFLLENQKIIYNILKMDRIEVKITDSFMLVPEKSATAISGVKNI